jgi:hypothetical protein
MWDREYLDKNTTAAFRTVTYKVHREKMLKDREQARLPATQDDAIALKDARRIQAESKADILRLREELNAINTKLYQAERRSAVSREVVQSTGRLRMPVVNTLSWDSQALGPDVKKERAAFVKPCPAPSCKGFLSTAWKCGLCETWTCPDCHDWRGESKEKGDHTCDSGKVATARLLAREARACPKCGVSICKIEGCDQMFCTSCNTGFNWRTGKVAEGPVHNPHYFEWLRRTGRMPETTRVAGLPGLAERSPGGLPGQSGPGGPVDPATLCGIELDRAITMTLQPRRTRHGDPTVTSPTLEDRYLMEAWRIMHEEEDNERGEESVEEIFRTLRVKYLCDEYTTADSWAVALQRAEKNATVRQTKADLRTVYIAGARDLIRQVLNPGANKAAIKNQVEELVVYCNKCREEAAIRFKRIMPPLVIEDRLLALQERRHRRIEAAAAIANTVTVPLQQPQVLGSVLPS